MLPYLDDSGGVPSLPKDFDQTKDAKFGYSYIPGRVCAGISLDWIIQHSTGKMSTFMSEMHLSKRFSNIERTQTYYNDHGYKAGIEIILQQGGYNLKVVRYVLIGDQPVRTVSRFGEVNESGEHIFAGQKFVSNTILATYATQEQGYAILGFGFGDRENLIGGHATAIFNKDQGCEFFDPDYGAAYFHDKQDFINWFDTYMHKALVDNFRKSHWAAPFYCTDATLTFMQTI